GKRYLSGWSPDPRDPLPAAGCFAPVAGNPLAVRRRHPPEAADPEVIVAVRVPSPVTRDPLNLVTLRLLVRWDFLDEIGRFFVHDGTGARRNMHRGRIGLVDGATRFHRDSFLVGRIGNDLRIGDAGRHQGDRQAQKTNEQRCRSHRITPPDLFREEGWEQIFSERGTLFFSVLARGLRWPRLTVALAL